MPLGWIKHLPITALLVSMAVTISGCNTIGGTVGGVGRDLSAIGNAFS
jgi:predicted small secreted protein